MIEILKDFENLKGKKLDLTLLELIHVLADESAFLLYRNRKWCKRMCKLLFGREFLMVGGREYYREYHKIAAYITDILIVLIQAGLVKKHFISPICTIFRGVKIDVIRCAKQYKIEDKIALPNLDEKISILENILKLNSQEYDSYEAIKEAIENEEFEDKSMLYNMCYAASLISESDTYDREKIREIKKLLLENYIVDYELITPNIFKDELLEIPKSEIPFIAISTKASLYAQSYSQGFRKLFNVLIEILYNDNFDKIKYIPYKSNFLNLAVLETYIHTKGSAYIRYLIYHGYDEEKLEDKIPNVASNLDDEKLDYIASKCVKLIRYCDRKELDLEVGIIEDLKVKKSELYLCYEDDYNFGITKEGIVVTQDVDYRKWSYGDFFYGLLDIESDMVKLNYRKILQHSDDEIFEIISNLVEEIDNMVEFKDVKYPDVLKGII